MNKARSWGYNIVGEMTEQSTQRGKCQERWLKPFISMFSSTVLWKSMLSNIWLPRPRPGANAIPACETTEVVCGPAVAIVYMLTLGGPTMYSRKWNTMRVMAMLMRLNQAPSTISRRSEWSTGMNNRARNSPSDKLNHHFSIKQRELPYNVRAI